MDQSTHHPVEQKPDDLHKDIAALSYIWVLSVIIFFLRRKDSFVHYHAKQGIVLFLLSIVGFLLGMIWGVLEQIVMLIVIILSLWGFLLAAHGKREEVPFAGPLARGKLSLRDSWKHFVGGIAAASHKLKDMWNNQHTDAQPKHPAYDQPRDHQE